MLELKETREPHSVLEPQDWISNWQETKYISAEKAAVFCMEHLLREQCFDRPARVLEVGPFDVSFEKKKITYVTDHRAPISLLSERNPHFLCAAIGPQNPPKTVREKTLGKVPFVRGALSYWPEDNASVDEMQRILGGKPDIVYAQHVIENNDSIDEFDLFPRGREPIFDRAANLLPVGGLIIVDNYGGSREQMALPYDSPYAECMKLHREYVRKYGEYDSFYLGRVEYSDSIFVFRKRLHPLPLAEHHRYYALLTGDREPPRAGSTLRLQKKKKQSP